MVRETFAGVFTVLAVASVFIGQLTSKAQACACCDTYVVTGVAHDDVLNVRSGPGVQYTVVETLMPGQCGVLLTGRRNGVWVEIRGGQLTGWVNRSFLTFQGKGSTQTCLQQGEECSERGCCAGLRCVMGRHEGRPWHYCEEQSTASTRPDWCAKEDQNAAESAICDTPELHVLDRVIATAYGRALSDSPSNAAFIRGEQRGWLRQRDGCGYDISCIRERYEEQIGWLEGYFDD